MQAMAAAHPGFSVLTGADPLMLPLLKSGGAGCITSATNLISNSMRAVFDGFADPAKAATIETAQARINAYRTLSNSYVQLPTIKAMLALRYGDMGWSRVRPPLLALTEAEFGVLKDKFASLP